MVITRLIPVNKKGCTVMPNRLGVICGLAASVFASSAAFAQSQTEGVAAQPAAELPEWYQITPEQDGRVGFAKFGSNDGELCKLYKRDLASLDDAARRAVRVPLKVERTSDGEIQIAQTYRRVPTAYGDSEFVIGLENYEAELPGYFTKIWPAPAPAENPEDARYDNLTREQVLAEQDDYIHNEGRVTASLKSSALAETTRLLEELGDGVILNEPGLAACGSPVISTDIQVPRGLERWYARKLVKEGVATSTQWKPPIGERNGGWSSIALASSAAVAAWLNPQVSLAQKNDTVGVALRDALLRFARARRPNFAVNGTVQRRQGGTRNVWRFEITGRSIAECTRNPRWEKLQIDFFVVGASRSTGIRIDANTVAGFYAPGTARPSETRFRENPYPDETLARFQEKLFGFLLTSGFRPTDETEAVATRVTQCPA